jgi:hypothetical protein
MSKSSCKLLGFSYHVLSRKSTHWSQLVSDDNPRGAATEDCCCGYTGGAKGDVTLLMKARKENEMNLKESIDDEYGVDRINAMIAVIEAE